MNWMKMCFWIENAWIEWVENGDNLQPGVANCFHHQPAGTRNSIDLHQPVPSIFLGTSC